MKIAHVITRFVRGGADENTLITCNAQAQAGDEVHLIYGAAFSEAMLARLDRRVRAHRLDSLRREIDLLSDVSALIALLGLFRRLSFDVVHTHTSKAGVIGRIAAWSVGAPRVIHGVHILPFDNVGPVQRIVYLGLERLLAPATHAFVNVSEGMRDIGVRSGVGGPDKHVVVPSGMNTGAFRQAAAFSATERAARAPDLRSQDRLLVFTAALEPRKRQYEFLAVFAEVRRRAKDVSLILLGEGHDEARLRARVATLGLDGSVHFLGHSDEVPRWIASADVCVFASEREGLPRAVIQYVLGGRPVVSTRLPGIEAVVRHGHEGFLVDIDRLEDMVDPIVAVLSDPALAGRIISTARARDLSAWDTDRMIGALAAVYRQDWVPAGAPA